MTHAQSRIRPSCSSAVMRSAVTWSSAAWTSWRSVSESSGRQRRAAQHSSRIGHVELIHARVMSSASSVASAPSHGTRARRPPPRAAAPRSRAPRLARRARHATRRRRAGARLRSSAASAGFEEPPLGQGRALVGRRCSCFEAGQSRLSAPLPAGDRAPSAFFFRSAAARDPVALASAPVEVALARRAAACAVEARRSPSRACDGRR